MEAVQQFWFERHASQLGQECGHFDFPRVAQREVVSHYAHMIATARGARESRWVRDAEEFQNGLDAAGYRAFQTLLKQKGIGRIHNRDAYRLDVFFDWSDRCKRTVLAHPAHLGAGHVTPVWQLEQKQDRRRN